jgi:hypothetical protein
MMQIPAPERLSWLAAGAGFIVCGLLFAPWLRLGGRSMSTVDLMTAATIFDLLDDRASVLVVVAWLAVPVMAATAILGIAARRPRLVASALVPLGPLVVVSSLVLNAQLGGTVLWGEWAAAAMAVLGTVVAVGALAISFRSGGTGIGRTPVTVFECS